MSKGMVVAVIGLLLFFSLLGVGWYFSTYNGLVNADENINGGWAEIANQYQRRYDLIPRLVNSTKMYINYETNLLTDIAEARSQWGKALASDNQDEMMEAATGLERVVGRLLMVTSVENYPELKGNTVVMTLMDELAGTENRIAVARGRYNNLVVTYNKKIRRWPTTIVANMAGFEKRDLFEIKDEAWDAPAVVID